MELYQKHNMNNTLTALKAEAATRGVDTTGLKTREDYLCAIWNKKRLSKKSPPKPKPKSPPKRSPPKPKSPPKRSPPKPNHCDSANARAEGVESAAEEGIW